MAWLQLTLELKKDRAEALELLMEELDALSITFTDAADEPVLEPKPGEMPLWQNISAAILFTEDTPSAIVIKALAEHFPESSAGAATEILEDREWLHEWKRDVSPKQYGSRLWVYPWVAEAVTDRNQVIVELEPGLAFGTGEHPTTAMCLEWLDGHDVANKSIMDYGCGSGLLAIAALKLGGRKAACVDIDPQAIIATRSNAERNGVGDRMLAFDAENIIQNSYDIVVANILSGILVDLSSTLMKLVAPEGWLVLTGILAEQAETVISAYAPHIPLSIVLEQDGWVLLAGEN